MNSPSVVKKESPLSLDVLKRTLPKNMQGNVTQDLVDSLNKITTDPDFRETYAENLISYSRVLKEGKYKLESYLDAVRYVSYKLMGDSNILAYSKTFPDRYQRMIDSGIDPHGSVAAYHRNKLVNLIMEQTLVPCHVLNQDLHQKAILTLAELMITARSEKVRADSATSLANLLKAPEAQKINISMEMKENKTIEELRNTTLELVAQQKKMLEQGQATAGDIAKSKLLIEGEVEDA